MLYAGRCTRCTTPRCLPVRAQLAEVVVLDGLGPPPELEDLPYGYQQRTGGGAAAAAAAAQPALHERFVEQVRRVWVWIWGQADPTYRSPLGGGGVRCDWCQSFRCTWALYSSCSMVLLWLWTVQGSVGSDDHHHNNNSTLPPKPSTKPAPPHPTPPAPVQAKAEHHAEHDLFKQLLLGKQVQSSAATATAAMGSLFAAPGEDEADEP